MKFFIGILFALTGIVVGSANAMTAVGPLLRAEG